MKRRRVPELGPLEVRILRILWSEDALTAPQVLERYNNQSKTPLAYTTVMTLLGRLTEKGVLSVDRSRQPYRFSVLIPRETILSQRIHDFVNLFFDGQPLDLATRLVEEAPFSDEAVEQLEQILRERRTKPRRKKDR